MEENFGIVLEFWHEHGIILNVGSLCPPSLWGCTGFDGDEDAEEAGSGAQPL